MDSILIKLSLENESPFLRLKTYDRKHGGRGGFLIFRFLLTELIGKPLGTTRYSTDCGSFIEIHRAEGCLYFCVTWLNEYGDKSVCGFRQHFSVSDEVLMPLLENGGRTTLLYTPKHTPATIRTSPTAANMIRKITQDKRLRRAFSKAMRDNFKWPGDEIMLHRDGENVFFFTVRGGLPKTGGLVLHESNRNGYPCVYFSVHT